MKFGSKLQQNRLVPFLKLGFSPCKAKQPLRGIEFKKKKHKKIKHTGNLFRKNLQLKGVC